MNPSVDIAYPLAEFKLGEVNRVDHVRKTAGGKGLNVARVIKLANQPVLASGLLGGTIGHYISHELDSDKIPHQFYHIAQESRNCIAILQQGLQTEILESGPTISTTDQHQFKQHVNQLFALADVVTLSGSLPKGVSSDYYAQLIMLAHRHHKPVLLDCSGNCLAATIAATPLPYLIKPNHEELSQLVAGRFAATDTLSLLNAIKQQSRLMQIPIIVASLGKEGALVKYHQRFLRVTIPKINVLNPVGSGDATLAGLAIGIDNQEPIASLLKRAMTFGMLNAQQTQTGYINMDHYAELYNQVSVQEIV